MTKTKKALSVAELVIVLLLLITVVTFSSSLVSLGESVAVKMALTVSVYVVLAAIPIAAMAVRKIPFSILGFKKEKIGRQLAAALVMLAFTVSVWVLIPLLAGFGRQDVLNRKSSSVSILIFYVIYDLVFVGFGEELAFRGYVYGRIKSLTSAEWLPMLLSAVLFGLWHYPNTRSLVNVASTMVLGLLYGFCRWRIKSCSLLSLSIAHGLHDATIVLLSFWLL